MTYQSRVPRRALGLLVLVGAAVAALAATMGHASGSHTMVPAIGAYPAYHVFGAFDAADGQPGRLRQCQLDGVCQGPDQIRNAYGFQQLLDQGITGAGRTIVIIDAYGSDTIANDLALFDGYFGLAPATLNVFYPDGAPEATSIANRFTWKGETTLDVESAHTIAPGATIDLVVAKSNDDADMISATRYVADHNLGDVVSQSFGEAEACMSADLMNAQHSLFEQFTRQNVTLLASSGDTGAGLATCDNNGLVKAASTPATDPYVTAVGGTDLVSTPATGTQPTSTGGSPSFEVSPGGQWISETVWNDGPLAAGGGGVSSVYSRPDFQAPVVKDKRMREVPDIAYSASHAHPILTVITCTPSDTDFRTHQGCGGLGTAFLGFAGTSAGTPQWAGLVALADQLAGARIGPLNKTLYKLGKGNAAGTYFHDVTVGDNGVPASVPGTPITGFAAAPGWDAATGWGTPIANKLVPALAKPGLG